MSKKKDAPKAVEVPDEDKPVSLEEIVPKDSSFKLAQFPDHTFTVKKFTLEDEIWVKNEMGFTISQLLGSGDMDGISRLLFRKLIPADRLLFKKQSVAAKDESGKSVPLVDEYGESVEEVMIGGYRLLQMCIAGPAEAERVLEAIMETMGMSRPIQKRISEEGKKKSEPEPEANWADIIEGLCHSYGWTLDDCLKLTPRQVFFFRRSAVKRINMERKFTASLHKMSLSAADGSSIDEPPIQMTEEMEATMAAQIKKSQEAIKKRASKTGG